MHDDGLRHLAEPICGACGGGLEYDGGEPRPEDIVACERCGASATYAEVAMDITAHYDELNQGLPHRRRRFAMRIVAVGREEDFKCNRVRLNY
jgi:hypothetical protein